VAICLALARNLLSICLRNMENQFYMENRFFAPSKACPFFFRFFLRDFQVKSRFTHRWVQAPGYMKQGQNMCAFQAPESSTPFRGRATLRNYTVFLCVFQPLGRAAWAECTCAQAQGVMLFSELAFEKDLMLSSTRVGVHCAASVGARSFPQHNCEDLRSGASLGGK
jgi:hypothetical protein